ncbi:2-oxoglutarate (2OG) and Fe(II)-dependent oxygenase superfamily protein [Quillaja saponaria]|uniref:2-oxoglutarate (2OG) and Fe(II)-dependent oxygenase superfamily protein n=1 Tax=Quillaja saponaria TaxID=32244 RepID=A0AAD7LFT5_QUISA|nr:2-oxoglutarate (2OG) and Fe(II)-dependent oxygenase superfamily protein [Quillaja saponaria]
MAEFQTIETELMAKSVQELSQNAESKTLLENFMYEVSDGESMNAPVPLLEIPVVNIGLLTSPSASVEEMQKMQSALSSCGYIQVINHGMESSFLDKVREVQKQFFQLPEAEKKIYSKEVNGIQGYGHDHIILSKHASRNWADRLFLIVYPEHGRNLKFWPKNPKAFREVIEEYTEKLGLLTEVIFKAMAKSLILEEDSFLKQNGEKATMSARFNYYPPCPRPDAVLGVKPHQDASTITYIVQDNEVESLQVLKDNQWFKVSIVPHAILLNVGNQVEIMSNGIFKSPLHRVVTNSERERCSLAIFCFPDPEKEIGPIDKLVTESNPRLYKTIKDYVGNHFQRIQQAKTPIEAAKI